MFSVSNVLSLVLFVSLLAVVIPQQTDSGQCTYNKEVVVENATVRFGLMMSMRKNDLANYQGETYTCARLSREPVQNFLAAEWAVERLNNANNGTGYIPGVKIGFYGMDDCRSAVFSSRNALSFLDAWVPSTIKTCAQSVQEALHIGLIGPSRSSTATRVASLLRDVPVPIISMSATSSELSNEVDYPTFFRTVPSDEHQVNMIVQILVQMSWTYVAIVYSNDDYGSLGSNKLAELAAKNGICIFKRIPIGDETSSYIEKLPEIIKAAKGNSLAIPFIGNRDHAEQFLYSLNKMARVENRDVRYGFHLILSESANLDVTVYSGKDIGVGTLTIGGSSIILDDVYEDLTSKVERVKSGTESHQLIEKYNSDGSKDALISPNVLDSFVPLTLHAVFALAEALRVEHQDACNGNSGVCETLKANVKKGNILKRVKNVTVDYKLMERGVPPDKFREDNYTVSFDASGDIKLVNKNPIYSIHQYRATGQYEPVGYYIDGQTKLQMENMKFLSPSGQLSASLPTSVCSKTCTDCLSDNVIPTTLLKGDVYILGVFSIHGTNSSNPFRCGAFRSVGNDVVAAEGFLYAVNDLRKITGINFGAIAIDDCYSPSRSTTILSRYFSSLLNSDISDLANYVPKEKLAGVVACRSSGCTISTAHFFMPINIPVVSYSASSPDLDSKIDFPYFLRTVPSDVSQARVMLEIVKTMRWEYVGLLFVKNNYGAKGIEAFKNLIIKEDARVCVAVELGINEIESDLETSDFRVIYQKFISLDVKVVIFFGIDVRYRSFLSFLENEKYNGKFIFIGSEDWGVNRGIYNAGSKSARGSLTLKVQDIQLDNFSQFKEHLASKIPSTNDSNIWFSEFWQNIFSCNLKGGFINDFQQDCDPSNKLSQEQLDARAGEQRVIQVMNAVYALGKGLLQAKKRMCEVEFPCNQFYQRAKEVTETIKEQLRQQGNLKLPVFDDNGNGALGFEIYNIQHQTDDGDPYVRVGTSNVGDTYGPNFLQKERLKFYDESGKIIPQIEAKCSEILCKHCPAPKTPDPYVAKENSSSMSEYRQSDILLISLVIVLILAVFVAIAAITLFFTKKYKGLKKQIETCKEEIYDEPDRIVYQPYTDTHGIRFSNAMNPYPIMSSVGGLNNFESNASDINGGVNNLAFVPEFDSVSQVMSLRNRQRSSPSDLQSQTRNDPISLVSTGQYVSPYSSRPLPVSPIGSDSIHRRMHGNQAYVDTRSESSKRANPLSLNDQSNRTRTPDLQSLAGGQVCLVTSSSLKGNDASESHIPEGIVYYMQGPNGQLAPHISSPLEKCAVMQQKQQPLQKQASVRSQNSSVSSSVNPSYGPYSTAAVQRMRMPQYQRQPLSSNNKQASPLIYGNSPIVNQSDINYNDRASIPNSGPKKLSANQAFTDHVDYSGIHFANPSRGTEASVPKALTTSHYQIPPSHTNQQQHNQEYPMSSGAIENDNLESTQTNFQYSDPEQSLHEFDDSQVSPDRSPDRSPDHSQHSMISSSIPDVVGQSSPALELERQASLESINLSSSKESLVDLNTVVKSPNAKKNNNGILSAYSALGGNISRV